MAGYFIGGICMAGKKTPNGFGSIRKKQVNGKTYYEGRYTDPILHKQKSVSAPTQKECREKMLEILSKINTGLYVTPQKIKIKDWATQWLDGKTNIKEGTRLVYQADLDNHILPALGEVYIKDLRPMHCQDFANSLGKKKNPKTKKPISAKTIHNVIGTLHSMLDAAQRLEIIAVNPSNNLELPVVQKKPIKIIIDDAQEDLVNQIENNPYKNIILVGLHTGARISEVLGLTWSSIDFDSCTVTIDKQLQRKRGTDMKRELVPTKTGNHRTIVVPQFIIDVFKDERYRQIKARLKAGKEWDNSLDLVFTREDGSPMPHTTIANSFKKAVTQIGYGDHSFHALRHTYATEEIASGTDPKTVSDNLGHTTTQITMNVYAAAVTAPKVAAANRRQSEYEERTQQKAKSN